MSRRGWGDRVFVVPRRWLLVGIIVAELAALFLLLDGNGWVRDDNYVMIAEGHLRFGWGWLTTVFFGHWGVSYNVVVAAVHKLMPLDNRWALGAMLLVLGASIYLMERIVRLLFGRPWLALVVAAYFGFSVLFVEPLQWWAGGLQYLPNTFCDLLCLYAYLRFQRDHAARWVVVGAGALAVGLSFYEKPAYMLVYLLLLRVLLQTGELRPRSILRELWSERIYWIAIVAVVGVWAVIYWRVGGGPGSSRHLPLSEYLSYFRLLWLNALVPSMFG